MLITGRPVVVPVITTITLATIICMVLYKTPSRYPNDEILEQDHRPPFSEIRCDKVGMSCMVTNLFIDDVGDLHLFVDPMRRDYFDFSGYFGHFGIGEPAAYFYIDTWTKGGKRTLIRSKVRSGIRAINAEREAYPKTLFVPLYVAPSNQTELQSIRGKVGGLTLITQTLWMNNFFRRLYIGAAAISTCHYWFGASSCRPDNLNVIHLNEPVNELIPGFVVSDFKGKLYEYAIIGILKRVLLPEVDLLMTDNYDLPLMATGYRAFSNFVQSTFGNSSVSDGHPHRVFAYRRGSQRRVINWRQMVEEFDLKPTIFEDLSLSGQIQVTSNIQLLVAAHGAALAHIFFMSHSSLVIELFPCDFKKSIYRNLALVLGIKYRWLQAGDPSDCPDLPLSVTIDWNDINSKNRFRNQNFFVNLDELKRVMVLDHSALFLTYMPFEQYNNQLISLRSACGMASILDRTLVLPELGYYSLRTGNDRRVYEPRDFTWQSLSRYLNTSILYDNLPCRTVPFSAYYGEVRSIDRIYFRRLGVRYNQRFQPESYFYFIAGLYYTHHRSLPYSIPIHNSRSSILRYFSDYSRSLKHFALGNVFWMYNFGAPLEYPMTRYVDMYREGDELYRSITHAINFTDRLQLIANGYKPKTPHYGAVHWRRGDYKEKCAEEPFPHALLPHALLPHACFPTIRNLTERIVDADPLRKLTWIVLSNADISHIATRLSKRGFRLHQYCCSHDPIECGMVDQIIAIDAQVFIGNMYSSFTRTIVDKRASRNQTFEFFS